MAAVQAAGPEPMIIIFSAISFLHLTGAYCGTPLHDYTLKKILSCKPLKSKCVSE